MHGLSSTGLGGSVLVLGDIYAASLRSDERPKGAVRLGDGLLSLMRNAGLCVANLEGVLCGPAEPIKKPGLPSRCSPEIAETLGSAGIGLVSLANNHAFDYGEDGLVSTIRALRRARIQHIGAGLNEEEAWRFADLNVGGRRIGFVGVSHNEFGVAGGAKPGVAGFDELNALRAVQAAKAVCDKVVVLYHGGIEYSRLPSPRLRRRCWFFLESGADAVICQHSHIAGAIETPEGRPLIYGQGDFIADTAGRPELMAAKCSAAVFELRPNPSTHGFEVVAHPIVSGQGMSRDLVPTGDAYDSALNELNLLSATLADSERWMREWQAELDDRGPQLEANLAQAGKLHRRLGEWIPSFAKRVSPKRRRIIENLIRCETHREILVARLEEE